MSKEDVKKGIAIQAKVDAKKADKIAEGLKEHASVLLTIEDSQQEIRSTVGVVLDDMSAAEAERLFSLRRIKTPDGLDETEKRVLCACIYTLLSTCNQNTDAQKQFYANLERLLGIRERASDFDFSSLENIDSHSDRLVILKVVCAFLYLNHESFDIIRSFNWILGFSSPKDIIDVMKEVQSECYVLGIQGLIDRYSPSTSDVNLLEEESQTIKNIEENQSSELVKNIELDSCEDYSVLKLIIEDYISDGTSFGKIADFTEASFVKELGKSFPRVSFDSLVAATKIENGYLFFTTYAFYIRLGGKIKGGYTRIPYKSICLSQITSEDGIRHGTRKLVIPFNDDNGILTQAVIDDSKLTEERLRDLLISVNSQECDVAITDRVVCFSELPVEMKFSFLASLTYIVKMADYSLAECYILTQKMNMLDEWNRVTSAVIDEDSLESTAASFISSIPYPSRKSISKAAVSAMMAVIAKTNRIEKRAESHLTLDIEKRIKLFDVEDMTSTSFNTLMQKAIKEIVFSKQEYSELKRGIEPESVLYADSIICGISTAIALVEESADYKRKRIIKEAAGVAVDVADRIVDKVSDVAEKAKDSLQIKRRK